MTTETTRNATGTPEHTTGAYGYEPAARYLDTVLRAHDAAQVAAGADPAASAAECGDIAHRVQVGDLSVPAAFRYLAACDPDAEPVFYCHVTGERITDPYEWAGAADAPAEHWHHVTEAAADAETIAVDLARLAGPGGDYRDALAAYARTERGVQVTGPVGPYVGALTWGGRVRAYVYADAVYVTIGDDRDAETWRNESARIAAAENMGADLAALAGAALTLAVYPPRSRSLTLHRVDLDTTAQRDAWARQYGADTPAVDVARIAADAEAVTVAPCPPGHDASRRARRTGMHPAPARR